MIVGVIAALEDVVYENISFHASVQFPEIVHVHLPDERPPLVVPEVFGQELVHKLRVVVDDHLSAVLRERNYL